MPMPISSWPCSMDTAIRLLARLPELLCVSNLDGYLADALFNIKIWSFKSLQAQRGKAIHIQEGFASAQQGW